MVTPDSFDVKFTSREVSAWGGLALLRRMPGGMDFKSAMQSWGLPKPGSNRGYSPPTSQAARRCLDQPSEKRVRPQQKINRLHTKLMHPGVSKSLTNSEGAALQPVLKQAAGLKKLGKEGQLAHGGGFATAAPLNLKSPAWCLHTHRLIDNLFALFDRLLAGLASLVLCKLRFTHLVSPQITMKPAYSLRLWHFGCGQLRKIG